MLHITESVKTLRKELLSIKPIFEQIINSLKSVTPQTNLTKEIGIYVVTLPNYKVLVRDAESAKDKLRKVCSGELSPADAIIKFKKALQEVNTLLKKNS